MKRFGLVLLLLGLMAVFSTQAMAVDIKVAGEYYAAGMYLDKTTLNKNVSALAPTVGPSTAFYFQRLRLGTEFVFAPGFKFITRADIMERAWGAARSAPTPPAAAGKFVLQSFQNYAQSAGTDAENENIAFDAAYIDYVSPIGAFWVGYMIDQVWGTVFGDNSVPTGKISYAIRLGGWTGALQMGKVSAVNRLGGVGGEQSFPRTNILGGFSSDTDSNFYNIANYYTWKNAEAGLLIRYNRVAASRPLNFPPSRESTVHLTMLLPYFKAKVGPVNLQGEIIHAFGQFKHDIPNLDDTRVEVTNAWLDGTADFGKYYAGGTIAYLSGQDPNTDAMQQGFIDGGFDWNPCLIMWNADRTQWSGTLRGHNGSAFDTPMANAWFFQARGGVRPVEKLDIGMSVSYANAVIKPTNAWMNNDYGWELDLTGTYKINNNLSYMVGGAYLFTGKYFKGERDANEIQDNYMLINKLTLTF